MAIKFSKCLYCGNAVVVHWGEYCRCLSCNLVLRNPMPSVAEVNNLYLQSWQQPQVHQNETGGMTPQIASAYVCSLINMIGIENVRRKTILDYGAGRGEMLAAFAEHGAEVYAFEPFGYNEIKKQGYKVFRDFSEIPNSLQFNGIFSSNVIEHLHTPWETLTKLKTLLKSDGWLFVTTPNARGFNARLKRGAWREAIKLGHLVLFSPASMENTLTYAGYKNIQRPPFRIDYDQGLTKKMLHNSLEAIGLEGELKYLAWNLPDIVTSL